MIFERLFLKEEVEEVVLDVVLLISHLLLEPSEWCGIATM